MTKIHQSEEFQQLIQTNQHGNALIAIKESHSKSHYFELIGYPDWWDLNDTSIPSEYLLKQRKTMSFL